MRKKEPGHLSVRKDFFGSDVQKFMALKSHYGLTVNMELVGFLVNKEYELLFSRKPRLERIAIEPDHIKVLDRELEGSGRILNVYYRHPPSAYCDYDLGEDCIHVDFAWTDPEARPMLTMLKFSTPAELRTKKKEATNGVPAN